MTCPLTVAPTTTLAGTPAADVATTTELPARGWTPERKVMFLDRLASHGNVRAACRAVGLSAEAAYRQRRRDPLFAQGWAAAVVLGRECSLQVLAERAIDGIEEDILYRGEVIGTRRRYDTRLLLAHIARLDALVEDKAAQANAARFDDLLLHIGAGEAVAPLPNRQSYVDNARQDAEDLVMADYEADRDAGYPGSDDDVSEILQDYETAAREYGELSARDADREWAELVQSRHDAVDDLCRKTQADDRRMARLDPALAALMHPPGAADANLPFIAPQTDPRTVSTVSTIALARSLSGPAKGFCMTPRSPYQSAC